MGEGVLRTWLRWHLEFPEIHVLAFSFFLSAMTNQDEDHKAAQVDKRQASAMCPRSQCREDEIENTGTISHSVIRGDLWPVSSRPTHTQLSRLGLPVYR